MGRLGRTSVLAIAAMAASAVLVSLAPGAQAAIEHPRVVQEQPSSATPHALDGAVNAFAQVGRLMIAGGEFTKVQSPDRSRTYPRPNLVAFDVHTGELVPHAPMPNGPVWALEPTEDGTGVYVAGRFTTVDGIPRHGIVKWDLVSGRIDPTFRPTVTRGRVSDLHLVNGRLLAGGSFPRRLVALDPDTGADTGYINLDVTGDVGRDGDGWTGQVYRFAVNPQQTRMVAIGNFTAIEGVPRRQIAMLDLERDSVRLSRWYSRRWDIDCHGSVPWYTRDVDWSPDGAYFVVVTTGGPFPSSSRLCDTASKWLDAPNPRSEPVWVNFTGGNSLHSVAVTGPAVYVGGHQQWLDNPHGNKHAGPGAVERPGIGAIHPVTGRALPWNPTRTRGVGAKALYPTQDGLWVGSDTDRFAWQYRSRIAFVPL